MRIVIGSALFLGLAAAGLGTASPAFAQGTPAYCVSDCATGFNFYVGAMVMHRSRPESAAIMTPPTGTPGVLVDAGFFTFDLSTGAEFVGQWRTPGGLILEGRYFTGPAATATHLVPAVTSFRTAGIGVTILGGGSINSTYSSRLSNNGEGNIGKQIMPGLALLAGVRTLHFNDTFRGNIATAVTYVQWTDDNNLVGGQIGLRMTLIAPTLPIRLDASFKYGLYRNLAQNAFTSTIVGGALSRETLVSSLGEINLSLTLQLNPVISLTAGYDGLFLGNVALASQSAAGTTQVGGGTSSPVGTGNVWYHGVTFGAGLAF